MKGNPAELDHAGRLIAERDAVDPNAVVFRFDRDTSGFSRELPKELLRVDLANLATVMDRLFVLLSGGSDGVADLAAYADEY